MTKSLSIRDAYLLLWKKAGRENAPVYIRSRSLKEAQAHRFRLYNSVRGLRRDLNLVQDPDLRRALNECEVTLDAETFTLTIDKPMGGGGGLAILQAQGLDQQEIQELSGYLTRPPSREELEGKVGPRSGAEPEDRGVPWTTNPEPIPTPGDYVSMEKRIAARLAAEFNTGPAKYADVLTDRAGRGVVKGDGDE